MQKAERGFRALLARAKRPRVAVPALLAFAAAVGLGGWALHAASMRRWAREEALPRARVLADQGSYVEAYQLAAAAEHYIPTDPRSGISGRIVAWLLSRHDAGGADAMRKPDANLNALGRHWADTVRNHRLPLGSIRLRLEKTGYLSLEVAALTSARSATLLPEGSALADMVRVPAATFNAQDSGIGALSARGPEDLIDRHEERTASPRGSSTPSAMRSRVLDGANRHGDRTLSWEDAMRRFRRSQGRPGPATRDGGAYKDRPGRCSSGRRQACTKRPHTRASRAASCRRVYHWFRAANTDDSRFLVPGQNFSGTGPWLSVVPMRLIPSVYSRWPAMFASGAGTRTAISANRSAARGRTGCTCSPGGNLRRCSIARSQRIPAVRLSEPPVGSFIDQSHNPASAARVSQRRSRKGQYL